MELRKEELKRSLKHIAGQKFTWFALSMVSITAMAFSTRPDEPTVFTTEEVVAIEAPQLAPASDTELITVSSERELPTVESLEATYSTEVQPVSISHFLRRENSTSDENGPRAVAEKLVSYANSLMGIPYRWGGITKKGFDCSGFVYHVYSKFDFDMERSSRAQSSQGETISEPELQKGDLLFFTGTNPKIRKVGHVGIVNSEPGEPVTFVHSSSNGGVKVSELEGYYNTRFMFAKRML